MRSRRRVANLLAAHPSPDHLLPSGIMVAWWFGTGQYVPVNPDARLAFFAGVAVVSGLVLAAATFVCALTYQSANILMAGVRRRYSRELKRNWSSIIVSAFLTAVGPIGAMLVDDVRPAIGIGVALYCIGLLVARAVRSVWWLNYTLFMQDIAESTPEKYALPPVRTAHTRPEAH
ncbi:hypothetical protein EV386_2540 [Xylanimonas ulmi]|uniref:Uncharacterized protein n=1 Tax=Xylanimonas ulmi TaxID=228973 RepID=A0A4Q7M7W0_9MICO|nr:hypothetical protein EV386_2540 [Xylanibacterium ulmi]